MDDSNLSKYNFSDQSEEELREFARQHNIRIKGFGYNVKLRINGFQAAFICDTRENIDVQVNYIREFLKKSQKELRKSGSETLEHRPIKDDRFDYPDETSVDRLRAFDAYVMAEKENLTRQKITDALEIKKSDVSRFFKTALSLTLESINDPSTFVQNIDQVFGHQDYFYFPQKDRGDTIP